MDTVTVYAPGHYDPFDSYGLIACELLRHLSALGVYVNAMAHGYHRRDNQPPDIAQLTARPIRPSLGGIFLGYATGYERHGPLSNIGPRIAVTMFESSRIPDDWITPLNEMDAVIVPSGFCRDVFIECGVTATVHVIPLGISETYQPVWRHQERPFTFLTFGDRGARKGGHAAMQAFLLAFGDDPDYHLIIKSRTPRRPVDILNDNITAVQQDMSEAELYELFKSAHCMINPNKGEGFGLIPREFAATGGIALATDWSGTVDDMHRWGWPLPYTLETADWKGNRILEGRDLGMWAKPDIGGTAAVLQDVATYRNDYLNRAWNNAQTLHELYSWRGFAAGVYEVWQEAALGFRNRKSKILV
jgi:glycosyltransferase involved in cell wall biosynthesis